MFKETRIFFMIAETSIHAGSGESYGAVDLPLQRDVVKNLPIIQASGVKGSLRDYLEFCLGNQENEKKEVFKKNIEVLLGPEEGSEYSSSISITEAKVLFFPVKSLYGVFCYITSPMVLSEFFRNQYLIENNIIINELNNLFLRYDECIICKENDLISKNNEVIINDYLLKVNDSRSLNNLIINEEVLGEFFKNKIFPNNKEYEYWKNNFNKRVVIVNDNFFRDVVNLSTEIVTRNKINDDTGVVDDKAGGLWDEENLPSDTILYSTVFVSNPYYNKENNKNDIIKKATDGIKFLIDNLNKKRIQIGGHKTIGKGFVFINFFDLQEVKNDIGTQKG